MKNTLKKVCSYQNKLYICISNKANNNLKNKKMKNLSNETKTQTAIQMVIMDAIEKGHTNANELIEYMKSEVFEKAVKNYISMFNEA
jgi:hypothetical protein